MNSKDNMSEEEADTVDVATNVVEQIKKELECPVCDMIPSSLPVSCCSSGHIVCKDCLDKLVPIRETLGYFEIDHDKPCPVCRSPIGDNTSHLAGALISCFSDIACPGKIRGCSFQGFLEEMSAHFCPYKQVHCFVCEEQVPRKDFLTHRNKECIHKNLGNLFSFRIIESHRENPGITRSLVLVQAEDEGEVLVEVRVIETKTPRVGFVKIVGLSFFGKDLAKHTKMKIVIKNLEEPYKKLEVVTEIDKEMLHYTDHQLKEITNYNVILTVEVEGHKNIQFDVEK